jgi:hypothetical protein
LEGIREGQLDCTLTTADQARDLVNRMVAENGDVS